MHHTFIILITLALSSFFIGCEHESSSDSSTPAPIVRHDSSEGHASAKSVQTPSVQIKPPPGYVASDRWNGYMNEATGSSIMIVNIPGPFDEVTDGIRDKNRMQSQGMQLIDHQSVSVGDRAAVLLHVEQAAYETLFKKWILAVDQDGSTTLITASYPSAKAETQEQLLKDALLAATFEEQNDPMGTLAFRATPIPPFEVARIMGQTLLLTPNGVFPANIENMPIMILGLSATEGWSTPEQRKFAEDRVKKTAMVDNITVETQTSVTIGDLSGYKVLATGEGERTGTPLTIYQVILYDSSGYCLIQGITPTEDKDTNLPIFEGIAKTFTLR